MHISVYASFRVCVFVCVCLCVCVCVCVCVCTVTDASGPATLGPGSQLGQDPCTSPDPLHLQGVCAAAGVHVSSTPCLSVLIHHVCVLFQIECTYCKYTYHIHVCVHVPYVHVHGIYIYCICTCTYTCRCGLFCEFLSYIEFTQLSDFKDFFLPVHMHTVYMYM